MRGAGRCRPVCRGCGMLELLKAVATGLAMLLPLANP